MKLRLTYGLRHFSHETFAIQFLIGRTRGEKQNLR